MRCSFARDYPVHDSDSILLIQSKHYYENIEEVKNIYLEEYDNWHVINGLYSPWRVWNESKQLALFSAKQIQQYLTNTASGKL